MKGLKLITILLTCAVALAGYAASPKQTGYLSDYDRLVEGEYLEAYWIDMTRASRSKKPSILLGEISVDQIKDHKGVTVGDCAGWLKSDLLGGSVVTKDRVSNYRLDLAVTSMTPGSAAKRILAGEFGAGHAFLQVEGRVTDTESGEVVAEFAERRRSSGAIGLEDLGGNAGPHIIEHLVKLISEDVTNELLASFVKRN